MAIIIKCKMCGGDLDLVQNSSVATCQYCGSIQTVPNADNDKKLTLFGRANRLRAACDFDKAAGIYESIVAEFSDEAEAYWGLVLCKYGIEYVDDPATNKKIPTCHRSSFESVMEDVNLEQAVENADVAAQKVYRAEAKAIEQIRKGILEISSKEDPYDIFICYKETDENGDRTLDSVIAQDMHDALVDKGYRVFFSRITLEDKLGEAYEPYIFAALNSAKVMLAVGTCFEHYNAVWVKNEWSRYLKICAADKSKHLIPCYKNLDAYDMPKEFQHLQGQDMGKMGAMQDILRGVEKMIAPIKQEPVLVTGGGDIVTQTLERAYTFLNEEDWSAAKKCLDTVLGYDPRNAAALIGCLMCKLQISREKKLSDCKRILEKEELYQQAVKYADAATKQRLEGYNKDTIYAAAVEKAGSNAIVTLKAAIKMLESLADWKDSRQQIVSIQKTIERLSAKKKKTTGIIFAALAGIALIVGFVFLKKNYLDPQRTYKAGIAMMEVGDYDGAIATFQTLDGYNDSNKVIKECTYKSALALMNAEQYDDAIALLKTIEDYSDSKEIINEHIYSKAIARMDVKEYEEAIALFNESRYADSAAMILECKYRIAVDLKDSGEYSDAIQAFHDLGTYKDSANMITEIKKLQLLSAKERDLIIFGSLPKEENSFHYWGDITWKVICRNDNRMLLVAYRAVAQLPYQEAYGETTWENSSIRNWLNNSFLNNAFTESERSLISTVTVTPDGKLDDLGNDTQDKVFLLSASEVNEYFVYPPKVQINEGMMLRTLGNTNYRYACVSNTGKLNPTGVTVDTIREVHPAIWIDLNKI